MVAQGMAGHSKWANIKRRKGAQDAKRGKIFTKLVREITTASRLGGADPDANPRLRLAIVAAKAESMPADNIDRAIKKGAGISDGPAPEEIEYEGYGPAGVAFVVETQTDNRNRTGADVRAAFSKVDGNLGQSGAVGWMFKKIGQFSFDAARYGEEEIMEVAMEGGADDIVTEDGQINVFCEVTSFGELLGHFDKHGMNYDTAELTRRPDNTIAVEGNDAEKVLRLVERLEDLDDVMKVHANFDISDDELERISNLD